MPVTNDIFGYKRNAKPNAVFSSEDSSLIVSSASAAVAQSAYMVQNWNMSYSQTVEEMFEIGSNNIYWMKGRPVGQGSIGRVVGPMGPSISGGAASLFPPEAFDLCKGGCSFTIQAVSGHCEKTVFTGQTDALANGAQGEPFKGSKMVLNGVVITQIGYSMAVPDVRLVENVGWRFSKLSVEEITST